MQARIELAGGADYFELGDRLRTCVSDMRGEAEAYIIRFYNDQQGCGYWSLYLEAGPEKGHCIFHGPTDSNPKDADEEFAERPDDMEECWGADVAEEMKAVMAGGKDKVTWIQKEDVELLNCDFEEWLATEYFSCCFECACDHEGQGYLGAVEEEYVCCNFTSAISRENVDIWIKTNKH